MQPQRHHSIGLVAVISILLGCAQVSSGDDYVFVAADFYHTCALTEDGHARCWGCEVGSSTSGTDAYEICPGCEGAADHDDVFERIDVRSSLNDKGHTIGVTTSGGVVGWGDYGCDSWEWQFEEGDIIVKVDLARHALTADGEVLWDCGETRFPGPYVDFSSNSSVLCAIRTDNSLECWQAGTYEDIAGVLDHPDGSFTAVDVNGATACALDESGAVHCWGCRGSGAEENNRGQCDGPEGEYVQFSVGPWHACAIDEEGTIVCWGEDEHGQASPPKGRFTQVAAGEFHTCGVRDDGHVLCWGCGNDRLHDGRNYGQCTPP